MRNQEKRMQWPIRRGVDQEIIALGGKSHQGYLRNMLQIKTRKKMIAFEGLVSRKKTVTNDEKSHN